MTKAKINPEDQLIVIKDSSIDVKKIVDQIRESIKKKRLAYLRELKQNLPSVIDTTENSEFLLDGWYENETIGNYRARWTKKEFSFLFNPGENRTLTLEIVATPPNIEKRPLALTLFLGKKKIGQKVIAKTGEQIVKFTLPQEYQNKNVTAKIKLSNTFVPAREKTGADIRPLGIAIKKISSLPYTEIGSKYIPQLTEFEYQAPLELEKIKYHVNPENLLPQKTRLKFFKKLILRTIRVFTSIQIGFNTYTQEFLKKLASHLTLLSDYIKSLDNKFADFQKEVEDNLFEIKEEIKSLKLSSPHTDHYHPIYWQKKENEFYFFHQNFFRGSYQEIKSRLKIYLKYLNGPKFYQQAPFIDFGCGRGEFLELLKENDINALGVDINSEFISQLEEKGLAAVQNDAIKFLLKNKQKIGGASAFHLIEHFSFPQLFDFLYLIYEKLKNGGVLILETLNPQNLSVGAWRFYYDFSHQKPIPPLLLQKILEFIGFQKIKIISLHPEKEAKTEAQKRLFGPQDYAIIAWK